MKILWACACGALVTGCAQKGDSTSANFPPAQGGVPRAGTAIVTPDNSLSGKVARVNEAARFVVLKFPVGRMAMVEQRLFVYHNGLKAGEVKVTGPQTDDHIVADLITGEAQTGDEVRDQ
jgi:hypothetical protein